MNSNKKTCIFCLQQKTYSQFNIEHVVPESIGGKYTVKSVCRACNEKLGKEIDTPLAQSKLMAIGRNEFQIKRGNRTIPNPFKGLYSDENGKKHAIRFNDKGEAYSILKPEICIKEDKVQITVDARNEDRIFELLDRELKKKGIDQYEIKGYDRKETRDDGKILIDRARNDAIIFGALKIAFEFTHEVCPGYIETDLSNTYRKILLQPKINDEIKQLLLEDLRIKKWFANRIKQMEGIKKYHHLVFLTPIKGKGLFCYVKLFDVAFLVRMSKSEHLNSEVILMNDAKNGNYGVVLNVKLKSFQVQLFSCSGQFKSNEIKTCKDGKVPIFDENGKLLHKHLDQLLNPKSLVPKRKEFIAKRLKLKQDFSDQTYFLKTKKEEGLISLQAVEFDLEILL